MDWENLRYFLELARTGTLAAAARRTGVEHTTVARRIQALEKQMGESLFARGARLDTTGKPGTGLGLAIVRDVAEIYGGRITLEESEDLGGLLARLTLPAG